MLDGQGNRRWQDNLPPQRCNVNSFSDPFVADYDTDGFPEVLAPTNNETLNIYNLTTRRIESRKPLTTYGFSQPMVGNVTAAPGPETAVIDLLGGTFVFEPPNETAWTRNFSDARGRSPAIRDFDADGAPEIPVGQTEGETVLLNNDGSVAWNRSLGGVITSKWMAIGESDRDAAIEIVRGSCRGFVFTLNDRNGSTEWRRSFSQGATVHALGDGDRDGQAEVYVATRNGTLYSLNASSGATDWALQFAGNDIQFAPPPAMSELDGNGDPNSSFLPTGGQSMSSIRRTGISSPRTTVTARSRCLQRSKTSTVTATKRASRYTPTARSSPSNIKASATRPAERRITGEVAGWERTLSPSIDKCSRSVSGN